MSLRRINSLKHNRKKHKTIWPQRIYFICFVLFNTVCTVFGIDDIPSSFIGRLLGYPAWCSTKLPCTLTLSCWFGGGSRVRGCGDGWFFSCCDESFNENFMNNWQHHSGLSQHPSNGIETNSFRRRVDDEFNQIECGIPASRILQKRIIGGREAMFAEFPWQAHVRISEFQCGGVLVSRRFVATAAHCVSRAKPRDITVVLGALDTSSSIPNNGKRIGVIQKFLHPLFQYRITQPDRFDIALLKLSTSVSYMNHILPICLPEFHVDLSGRFGLIAGWGKTDTSYGHTGTNKLRSATVPILKLIGTGREQCMSWHDRKQISVEIHSEMLCAGHSDGHQDACLGDSGGPLIILDSGRYILAGITSAGFGCGVDHQPGIYHNVMMSISWIRSVIGYPESAYDRLLYESLYEK